MTSADAQGVSCGSGGRRGRRRPAVRRRLRRPEACRGRDAAGARSRALRWLRAGRDSRLLLPQGVARRSRTTAGRRPDGDLCRAPDGLVPTRRPSRRCPCVAAPSAAELAGILRRSASHAAACASVRSSPSTSSTKMGRLTGRRRTARDRTHALVEEFMPAAKRGRRRGSSSKPGAAVYACTSPRSASSSEVFASSGARRPSRALRKALDGGKLRRVYARAAAAIAATSAARGPRPGWHGLPCSCAREQAVSRP
jgi:hypothetical protein